MSRPPAAGAPPAADDNATGFGGFLATWRTLYVLVIVVFVLVVAALAALPGLCA